ncbi:MAG: InlB B-repeat-containing protein [Bacteroidaceae bacterium]|nr:InlB B-repeat-containing protein [Bacteroidaceae bacterium]
MELQPATEVEYATYLSAHYYTLNLPDGVTASGEHSTYNNVDYYAPGTTVTLSGGTTPAGYAVSDYKVDGTPIGGTTFEISSNAIVTIVTTPIEYSITYHENGGTMPNVYPTTYDIESADITLPTLTRDGYTFGGWYVNDGLTGDAVTTITTGAYGAKEFWAKWTAHTYTVAFDKNNNDATGTMDAQSFTYGESAKALTANAFERTGYTFSGWNTAADGSGSAYTNQQEVQNLTNEQGATVTLYAQWTLTTYSITYHANDGTMPDGYTTTYTILSTTVTLATPTRMGYTFSGWKNGETAYDFNSAVTSYLTLTASWIAHTYTVQFDKNADDATGTMEPMQLTYDDWVTLGNSFSRTGYKFTGWNTKANGSGTSFSSEEWVRNLTDEDNGNVVLYAQWVAAINIATCSATVPDQTMGGYSYIYYKFESANSNAELAATLEITVKDGNKVLTLGTDYEFGNVVYAATGDGMPESVDDECLLEIRGIGAYDGSLWAPFTITVDDDNDTWGQLTWAFHAGTLTISGTGEMMKSASDYRGYTWFRVAQYVKAITIGEGITSVAAEAFAGTSQVNYYSNVTSLSLPSTLTTIGANAFAYCTGLSINLADLTGIDYPASAFSYINSITGTLNDNADNTKTITMMSLAGSTNITLNGRTLYKDNNWNTICLPFGLGDNRAEDGHHFDGTPFAGATVMELDRTQSCFDDSDGRLTLYFNTATSITAGKPYIVKWEGDGTNNLVNPEFTAVTVSSTAAGTVKSSDNTVSFKGNYSPVELAAGGSNYYLGSGNELYYPSDARTMNAFRAYFELTDPTPVKEFRLNFGNEDATRLNEE